MNIICHNKGEEEKKKDMGSIAITEAQPQNE